MSRGIAHRDGIFKTRMSSCNKMRSHNLYTFGIEIREKAHTKCEDYCITYQRVRYKTAARSYLLSLVFTYDMERQKQEKCDLHHRI